MKFNVALAAPGLLFFSLNKVLLNVLNGLRQMRSYAVFQAVRVLLILLTVTVMLVGGMQGDLLPLSLTVSEGVLFPLLGVHVGGRVLPFRMSGRLWSWLPEHLSFGVRGFLGGILTEMNTRVDVLMLGYFSDDFTVGIYSFAAILAEGLAQLPVVFRRNVDPILGRCFAEQDRSAMQDLSRRVKRKVYLLMGLIGVATTALYPVALKLLERGPELAASWAVFAILMAGIVANSGYRPFLGILPQGGRPGTQTVLVAALVGSNVVLNAILIPVIGIYGAAIATAFVYVLEALLIVLFARKLFDVAL